MSLVKWDSSFNVNIEMIDEQHKLLMKVINELYEAIRARKEKAVLDKLISKLNNYAVFHFAKEEHYFDIFGYPDAQAHKKEHSDFEARVAEFERSYSENKQALSLEMLHFLSDWLISHIKGSDKKYSTFFLERGFNGDM